ncbi:MAG TPA: pyridoxamine 5'-phosphate oxidase family protein [Acidimicrobiales bacterium]
MRAASPWHAGERAVQQRVGEVRLADRATGAIGAEVPPVAAEFLAQQRMLVVAATDAEGLVWASLLTGPPGFVTVPRPGVLEVAARPAPGDPLGGALAGPALLGTLAIEPATRRRSRQNGRSTPTAGGIRIDLDQVFANCPKYIQQREVVHVGGVAGAEAGDQVAHVGDALTGRHRRWIDGADTLFIGTTDADGNADASHRGGNAGFVRVLGPRKLRFPDYRGNSMYMTLGNLEQQPAAGLLFVDWTTGDLLHVSGRAAVDYDPAAARPFPGAQRVVDVEVTRVVESAHASPLVWGEASPSRFNPPVEPVTPPGDAPA